MQHIEDGNVYIWLLVLISIEGISFLLMIFFLRIYEWNWGQGKWENHDIISKAFEKSRVSIQLWLGFKVKDVSQPGE